MGCGSPLGDLFRLADTLLEPHASPGGPTATSSPLPAPDLSAVAGSGAERGQRAGKDLGAQLYALYGEGQIGEEVFVALRALADRGQLRPADVAVHRARARRRPDRPGDAEVRNALQGTRSRLARLAQARSNLAQVLADLDARLGGLDERMADKEDTARQAVGRDEDTARRRLAEKAELGASRDRLADQAQAVRQDLARLDDLRAQLDAKAVELEAVRARGDLAALDAL